MLALLALLNLPTLLHQNMFSTIQLFKQFASHIPPLAPFDVKQRLEHALKHVEEDDTVTLKDVERSMIEFGYELWPYNQAYREFLSFAEHQMGEHFLLSHLSPAFAERYEAFKQYGGTWRDLHSGRPATFFNSEERNELCVALVEMRQDLEDYTKRLILGTEHKRYLEKVVEFRKVETEVKAAIVALRTLADKTSDHPALAGEIESRIEAFEQGLCSLGPELEYHAVCESFDYFAGRHQEFRQARGIHVPGTFDWNN